MDGKVVSDPRKGKRTKKRCLVFIQFLHVSRSGIVQPLVHMMMRRMASVSIDGWYCWMLNSWLSIGRAEGRLHSNHLWEPRVALCTESQVSDMVTSCVVGNGNACLPCDCPSKAYG